MIVMISIVPLLICGFDGSIKNDHDWIVGIDHCDDLITVD